jgi:ABC-2 type transport system ATP-binding protein
MTRVTNDPIHGRRTRRTALKTVGSLAALAAIGTGTAAADTDGAFTKIDHEITSFDGTDLAATLYEPAGNGRTPAMLMTHGYGGTRSDVDAWASMYARNGYTTLTYDSRGFGNSGGEVNVDGPKEVKDAQTLITWLADDENATVRKDGPDDPKIGMDGLSYGGGIQLNTAAAEGRGDGVPESDDRIDAIVPRWAWHDLRYSLAPNGVIKSGWETLLLATGAQGGHLSGNDAEDYVRGQTPELYEFYAEALARNEYPEEAAEFFESRSPVQDIEDITAPALFVHGWPDTLFTPNEAIWNAEGLDGPEHRYIFFEGGHTLTDMAGAEQKNFIDRKALEWIDTHVSGGGNTDRPPVTYYEVQTGKWSTTDSIPPSNATPRTLSLTDAAEGEKTPVFNSVIPTSTSQLVPVNADTSVTSIDFDFLVEEEIEVLGAPQLELAVEPLGPEARLFTKFYHVSDGEETLINNQVTPLRMEGEPESVETVEIEMTAFQRRLDSGDTLRFTVATTDAGFLSSRTSAGAYIHHSKKHPSTVDVPAIGGGFVDSGERNAPESDFLFG